MRAILNQTGSSLLGAGRRYRIAGAILAITLFGIAAAFGTSPHTVVYEGKISEVIEPVQALPAFDRIAGSHPANTREVRIQRGDNLTALLSGIGIDDDEAMAFLRTDHTAQQLARQLVPGKTVTARVSPEGQMESLIFPLNESGKVLVIQRSSRGFGAHTEPIAADRVLFLRSATIHHSLFGAADNAGIPDTVALQLAEIFGGDIDFHRDLHKGDKFQVVYEEASHLGRSLGTARILAAEFINDGKVYRAFWHQPENGSPGGYYTESGRSIKKAFLRSPLEFSRITSGFSNARYHPLLREIRAHRGIDYAAPIGTRVKSTADGTVDFVGVQGGYGKMVAIRHAGNCTTVYGHLSGFAPGLKKGVRVSQGEVIGFVGATGLATGPHLHYEFRLGGVHRNPQTIALPDAVPLAPTEMDRYRANVTALSALLDSIRDVQLALLD